MPTHSTATRAKVIDVVYLVAIDQKDQILVTQRAEDKPLPLLWEFPGGDASL
jgi:8-oxo-dGTP pyrophosphatase MutT (NUDIX family)